VRHLVAAFRIATAAIGVYTVWYYLFREDSTLIETFTVQSNIMLAAVMSWAAYALLRHREEPPAFVKGGVTLYMVITAVVYAVVLVPPVNPPAVLFGLPASRLAHILLPTLAVIDFLLFDRHRRFPWKNALLWLSYPLIYCTFIVIRGVIAPQLGYPYAFLEVPNIGYGGLAKNVAMYTVAFGVLGLMVVAVDRRLPRRVLWPRTEPDDDVAAAPAADVGAAAVS
jgi:hypothetical protein